MARKQKGSSKAPHSKQEDVQAQVMKTGIKPDFKLDGRTLEGGGQLLRVALCLSALTNQSVYVTNIRGNRLGQRGLKNQHLACVQALAAACNALTVGAHVGSEELLFAPDYGDRDRSSHGYSCVEVDGEEVVARLMEINPPTPGAITLILQAVVPYLLFGQFEEPTRLKIRGATHTTSSPGLDYFDSVLVPNLIAFGLPSNCIVNLNGPSSPRTFTSFTEVDYLIHSIKGRSSPLSYLLPHPVLQSDATYSPASTRSGNSELHAYILFGSAHERSQGLAPLVHELRRTSNGAGSLKDYNTLQVNAAAVGSEDLVTSLSGSQNDKTTYTPSAAIPHGTKSFYVLLIATRHDGVRVGADVRRTSTDLTRRASGEHTWDALTSTLAAAAVGALESSMQGCQRWDTNLDEHMRDQIVVFLSLLGGRVSERAVGGHEGAMDDDDGLVDENSYGLSLHAQTAIWVTELMLGVKFDADGAGVDEGWLTRQRNKPQPISEHTAHNDEAVIEATSGLGELKIKST